MNKLSRIIALVLSIAMAVCAVFVFTISASAAASPSLSVVQTGKSGDKVTVAVNLNSGSFNAMDFKFNMSDGVTCDSISAVGGYGNKNNGMVSMASVDPYTGGSVITATFTVPSEGSYNITGSVSDCAVTEGGTNVNVSANVSGSASGTNTTTTSTTKSTTKKTDPTKSTTKSTTKKTTPTKSTKSTTTKRTDPKKSTTSTTISTTSIPTVDENTTNEFEDGLLDDGDSFAPAGDIVESDDANISKRDEREADDEDEKEGINPMLIGGAVAAGAVLVGGAVIALVVSKKRNSDDDDYEDD